MVNPIINLENIAKETLEEKSVIVKRINEKLITVCYYGTSPRNTPKPITFPRIFFLDKEFAEAIGIYVGDGKLTPNDLTHSELSTTDKDIAKFFLKFLTDRLYVKLQDISFIICYRKGDKEQLKKKWSKILKVPKQRFLTKKKNKYDMKDNITFQVNSIIFTIIFRRLINISLSEIKNNSQLRRSFLRGEFASDGKFGVEKDTNTYYISEVTFCYDYKKEKWLRDFIIECLKLEGIKKFNSIKGYIRITGWDNYLKFWNMNLFDRCLRKKNKFLKVLKQMYLYFEIRTKFLNELLKSTKLPKSKLLKVLNLYRTNFKRVTKGIQLLNLNQLQSLILITNSDWRDVLKNTNRIRIGKQTYLNSQENFIRFVINHKN